jgi:iron complex transport system permease protein
VRFIILLALALLASLALAIAFGETGLSAAQYAAAFAHPASAPGEILWSLRAPRAVAAGVVGVELGLAGAVMQGLLRNPLADPGVFGVSGFAAFGAAAVIAVGFAGPPGMVEAAAMVGALTAGALVAVLAAWLREPETLVLFGVALSAMGGALTALVFNLSPSPVTTSEMMNWLLGSAAGRGWNDIAMAALPTAVGALLSAYAARGLSMLSLGEETAALSGLPMARLRVAAVAGAALLTGAAVAMAGVIGFVGLAAPPLARGSVYDDPAKTLVPSALIGAILLVLADLAARMIPTEQELKLGVVTALFGAPLFAVLAWRAARSWRA